MATAIKRLIRLAAIVFAGAAFSGCSDRQTVGGGYVLLTAPALIPDHYPGTSLRWRGQPVWDNVYVGYFSPHDPAKFLHDDTFIFVGPVPGHGDWWICSQLFVVRGKGPPVVISERVVRQRLVVTNDSRFMSHFSVLHLSPSDRGVRVVFKVPNGADANATQTNELTWAEIGRMLEAANDSSRLVNHVLGNYRVLPLD